MNGEIEMEIKTKKYRVMEDLMMKILLADFDTLKEARAFFRRCEFEYWAEAWIQKDDGTVVQRKNIAGETFSCEIGADHRRKWN